MRTETEVSRASNEARTDASSGSSVADRDARVPGAAPRGGAEYGTDRPNLGSARSDYGSHAYGGSLDEEGLGGKSVDDYNRGRRDVGSRGYRRLRRENKGDSWSGGWMLLGGIGLGAALMYMLDPDRGSRRRALVKDKIASAANNTPDALGATSRDLTNRARGLAASVKSVFTSADASDEVIVQRVRSQIGRVNSHPGSIEVTANQGRVTLGGPILASETDDLLSTVRKVRGVKDVDNQLEVHEQAGNVPGLQDGQDGQSERAAANDPPQEARGATARSRQ